MEQLFRRGIIITLTVVFILAGSQGCKDDYESTVPYVPVDYNLNPSNIIELNIPGGSYYLPRQGYSGIIIFRDLVDSQNPFLAYDATCTYELSNTCHVIASDASGIVECPCCGSRFILFGGNGNPTNGPAVEPLRQYRTFYSGSLINIRN